jgi:hypothetical protein
VDSPRDRIPEEIGLVTAFDFVDCAPSAQLLARPTLGPLDVSRPIGDLANRVAQLGCVLTRALIQREQRANVETDPQWHADTEFELNYWSSNWGPSVNEHVPEPLLLDVLAFRTMAHLAAVGRSRAPENGQALSWKLSALSEARREPKKGVRAATPNRIETRDVYQAVRRINSERRARTGNAVSANVLAGVLRHSRGWVAANIIPALKLLGITIRTREEWGSGAGAIIEDAHAQAIEAALADYRARHPNAG